MIPFVFINRSFQASRRGTVLIVVAGLAALLLTMFLVLSRQVRNEVNDGVLVLRDAQARLMLSSALAYILEAGRLYGTNDGKPGFGWTDVRDGSIGPKGPVDSNGGVTSIPQPLPVGMAARFCMEAMVCPPQAVSPIVAYNPVSIPPGWVEAYESASTELEQRNSKIGEILFITYSASNTGDSVSGNTLPLKSQYYINPEYTGSVGNPDAHLPNSNALYLLYNNVYQYYIFCPEMNTPAVLEQMTPAHFNLQPQPVASNDTDFLRGNPAIRPESQRKSWFRIYRIDPNTASDTTTGNGEKSTGDYGQFIVTCGAGGTEGYKTFGDAPNGKFLNAEFFKDLRRQERILWYRVKWSAFVGGGADMAAHYGGVNVDYPDSIGFTGGYTDIALRNRGGIFRQDKETVNRQANNRFLQRRFSSHSKRDEQSMNSSNANRTDGVSVYQTNPRVLLNVLGSIIQIERLENQPGDYW